MNQLFNITEFEAFSLTTTQECQPKNIRLLHVFGRGNSAIFVTKDDKVYGIGHNRNSSLGLGHTKDDYCRPQLNKYMTGKQLVCLVSGFEHCLALTASGQCYSWGQNRYGQLGIGTVTATPQPMLIDELANEKVVQIGCGAYHSLALTSNGDLFSWGHNTFAQLGDRTYNSRDRPTQVMINEKISSISCGINHSMALTEKGFVYLWGANTCGQLGRNPDYDMNRNREKPMSNRPKPISGLENCVIKKAICGPNHNLILTTDGVLYGFGDNSCGQVGNGTTDPQFTPTKLNKQMKIKIKDIFSHFDNDLSLAVSEDNRCYVWGLVSNQKILKPKLIDNSFGKSLFDIYIKFAKNQITFQTVNIEDIDRFILKPVVQNEDNFVSNEFQKHSNPTKDKNQLKRFEKVVNIGSENQFNGQNDMNSDKQKIFKQNHVFDRQTNREMSSMSKSFNSGKEFLKNLLKCFNNPDNYDLKIVAEDKTIYCHKTILQIRNEKFWEILSQKLSSDNQIKINPQTYPLFYAFLQFMYGIEPEIKVCFAEELKSMAQLFSEPELEDFCTQVIKSSKISINSANICTLYQKAIDEGLPDLEMSCIEFAANNWKSVFKSDAFISLSDSLSKKLMISIHNK